MKYKIQDIKLPTKTIKPKGVVMEKKIIQEESRESRDYSWGMWLLAGIAVLFLVFSLSLVFSRAKVTVEAKKLDLPVDTAFNLTKAGGLVFEVAMASGEEVKKVTSATSSDVLRKAHGTALLYNTTSAAQKLLIETRLTTPDGKIFKTDTATTVPKGTTDAPGSVEVGVTAEKPGEDYNVGLVDFKILGFKGTAKYDKFYGRTKKTIEGGLTGKHYVLNQTEAEATLKELKDTLKEKLVNQISLQTPEDYFVLPDIVFIDTSPASFESETTEVTIKATGKIYAVILNEKNLGQELGKKNIADLNETPVIVDNLKELVFTIKDKEKLSSDPTDVSFAVTGDAKIRWGIDTSALRQKLVGTQRKDFTTVLADFPAIERAELKVLPFWKRALPANVKNIKVTVN